MAKSPAPGSLLGPCPHRAGAGADAGLGIVQRQPRSDETRPPGHETRVQAAGFRPKRRLGALASGGISGARHIAARVCKNGLAGSTVAIPCMPKTGDEHIKVCYM